MMHFYVTTEGLYSDLNKFESDSKMPKQIEDTEKIVAAFHSKIEIGDLDLHNIRYYSVVSGVRQGSDELMEVILSEDPPPLSKIESVVNFFHQLLDIHFLHNEMILEAFAKVICTAGAHHFYNQRNRHAWLSKFADLLKQRLIEDLTISPVFWVYYGRIQLIKAGDYHCKPRADILEQAIEFLELNRNDPDTLTMIGVLKAEIYHYCRTSAQRTEKEWFEIRNCFTKEGLCLDPHLHYAVCLVKKNLLLPNNAENYQNAFHILGPRRLAHFDQFSEITKTDLWWRECTITITDACVRTTLNLTNTDKRQHFLSHLSKQLREEVIETVGQIETPVEEYKDESDGKGVVYDEDFD